MIGPASRTGVAFVAMILLSTGRHASIDADFARSVRAAASELPFPQAQALWLVDVCGCSYTDAATEAGTTSRRIARRVALGRRALRRHLSADTGSI